MSSAGKSAYRRWLATSFDWQTIRMMALIIAKNKCAICAKPDKKNDVHHLWYRGTWGETEFYDTRVLCRKCHKRIHELTKPAGLEQKGDRGRYEKSFEKAARVIRRELNIDRSGNPRIKKQTATPEKYIPEDFCRLCKCEPAMTRIAPKGLWIRVCLDCWSVFVATGSPKETFNSAHRKRHNTMFRVEHYPS